jgi:hypothetical protein
MRVTAPQALLLLAAGLALAALPGCHGHAYLMVRRCATPKPAVAHVPAAGRMFRAAAGHQKQQHAVALLASLTLGC